MYLIKPIVTLILLIASAISCCSQNAPIDVVILGDSNIWLAGDDCSNPKGWATWMRKALNPRTCRSYARSGASWSHTIATKDNPQEDIAVLGDDNVIYNQVLRLRQAIAEGSQPQPSIIIVAAGGNDAWFANKRPLEFDQTVEQAFSDPACQILAKGPADVTSLPAAIRYDCLILKKMCPKAQIVFTTSTPMAKVAPEMLTRVCDIIEESGMRMDIPTLRLDNAGLISRDQEMAKRDLTYDGIHTSEKGAKKVGQYVASRLKELMNIK